MVMSFYSKGSNRINFLVVDFKSKKMQKHVDGSSKYRYDRFEFVIPVTSIKEVIFQFERQGFKLED